MARRHLGSLFSPPARSLARPLAWLLSWNAIGRFEAENWRLPMVIVLIKGVCAYNWLTKQTTRAFSLTQKYCARLSCHTSWCRYFSSRKTPPILFARLSHSRTRSLSPLCVRRGQGGEPASLLAYNQLETSGEPFELAHLTL